MFKPRVSYFIFSYAMLLAVFVAEVQGEITLTLTSGDDQSTTRGNNFPESVTFTLSGTGGVGTLVSILNTDSNKANALIRHGSSGGFRTNLNLGFRTDGAHTVHIRPKQDSYYDTCKVKGIFSFGGTNHDSIGTFTGTITDVLYFSSNTATRSIDENTEANTNIGNPVSATHWANADTDTTNDVTLEYSLEGNDASSFSIVSTTGQLQVSTPLDYETTRSYTVKVKVEEKGGGTTARSSDTIDVTINVNDIDDPPPPPPPDEPPPPPPPDEPPPPPPPDEPPPPPPPEDSQSPENSQQNPQSLVEINAGTTETLTVQRIDSRTVTLSWEIPTTLNADTITGYQYSIDGGQTWTSTGSTNTSITITQDGVGDLPLDQFKIRAMNRNADSTRSFVIISARTQPRIIHECPVGWVRSDRFGGPTQRVLLYEVNLEMDLHNPVSIYKPIWVAIYVHPDEGLENLDGWKLQVAVPYNRHREYPLTAENSIVVDAGFVEGGFAFIANPQEAPFPMIGMGFTGATVPGFDYRLYDDTGQRVDFGIACYKRGDIFQALKEMEDPRVLRNVLLETLNWDAATYIRSEWTVPVPAPAAPSLVKKTLVGTWANLKKR